MNAQPLRLPQGGLIDRRKPLNFTFDGRAYQGCAGDTLASALLANGVRVVGRSFRLHRPRGVMGAGVEDAGAYMQIGSRRAWEPNVRATDLELYEGLEARAVNAWPSARFDVSSALGAFRRFLGAGFYYKTFLWPRWSFYAGMVRRMGGLGRAPQAPDDSIYAGAFAHCDVLVVGGGPAGLEAAAAAAGGGARVMLVDDQPALGGALLGVRDTVDGLSGAAWAQEMAARLETSANVRVLRRTTATGWYDHNLVTLVQSVCDPGAAQAGRLRQRFIKVRARRVVLAAGAIERPLVFANNDRPGVMLASAARAYAVRYGVAAGRRGVVATNNDSGLEAALDMADAGVPIALVTDMRPQISADLAEALAQRGIALRLAHAPIDVEGPTGVSAVRIAPVADNGRADVARGERIACDFVGVSGGWNPTLHLYSQAGGRAHYEEGLRCFVPGAFAQPGFAAGAAAGQFTTAEARSAGAAAGAAALRAGFAAAHETRRARAAGVKAWEIVTDGKKPAWVDLQYDVTSADIRAAAAENFKSVEHLKRFTTLGMALDQGKTSSVNGIGVLSEALHAPIANIGTTRFRPPYTPVALGALAGRRLGAGYHALKRSPMHDAVIERGGAMEDYGGWLRPAFFAQPGEDEETAVRREAAHVRASVGVFDASPLGKLRVVGRDAGLFLDRMYVNTLSNLKVGRCRYALLLNEHGAIIDDGVIQRDAPDAYFVGTTSAGADRIRDWLDEWAQCEWPELDVRIEPVTTQWATAMIAGPSSRALVRWLAPELEFGDAAFAHMTWRSCAIAGVPARIARVSYTGERCYEVSVPADRGDGLWRACVEGAHGLDAAPFGVEALMRLRLEKGFLHVGADTMSDTYPDDVGFGAVVRAKRSDFVGRRSTMRENARGPRRQLVGLAPIGAHDPLPVGGHVLGTDGRSSAGWITSSGYSPALNRYVALALVENGAARLGEQVIVFDRDRRVQARIAPACAYDREGARLDA